jgi:hypothetical protein
MPVIRPRDVAAIASEALFELVLLITWLKRKARRRNA